MQFSGIYELLQNHRIPSGTKHSKSLEWLHLNSNQRSELLCIQLKNGLEILLNLNQ